MNKYVEIVNAYYPGVECYSVGDGYENIYWLNGAQPIAKADLESKMLEYYKAKKILEVKEIAVSKHAALMQKILGTTDAEQFKVYDEKYIEAQNIVSLSSNSQEVDPNNFPLLHSESMLTGENVVNLAGLVLEAFTEARNAMKQMIGTVEGIRRVKAGQINNLTSLEEIESFDIQSGWPSL